MSWAWGHRGSEIQQESFLETYLVHLLRFTENPGDPHKMLKLQHTGLLKMTLKLAYFIMLNTTMFSCDTVSVRNLKMCPRSPILLFVLNSVDYHCKLVVRFDPRWVLFGTSSIFSHILVLDNLMAVINNQLTNKYFWSTCYVLGIEIRSLTSIKQG